METSNAFQVKKKIAAIQRKGELITTKRVSRHTVEYHPKASARAVTNCERGPVQKGDGAVINRKADSMMTKSER